MKTHTNLMNAQVAKRNTFFSIAGKLIAGIILLTCLFCTPQKSKAQTPAFKDLCNQLRGLFAGCLPPDTSIHFFYDMAAHMTDSVFFGNNVYDTSNVNNWYFLYREMYYSAYDTLRYISDDSVFNRSWPYLANDTIPVGIMDWRYNLLIPGALTTGTYFLFDTVTSTLSDNPARFADPYTVQNIFAASPLDDESSVGNPVFMINKDFIFAEKPVGCNTCVWHDDTLKIDFDDGTGWHVFDPSVVTYYQPSYSTTGVKMIKFGLFHIGTGAMVKYSNATFRIASTTTYRVTDTTWSVVPGLKAHFFFGCDSNENKKYVIYLEGLDPLNNRHANEIYNDMIKDPQIAQLKNFGYSFIVVDWDNSYRSIVENAMSVVNLIDKLKESDPDLAPLVVIGESMGGLVGRYALRYMELVQYTGAPGSHYPEKMHNTRLFITFDTPHEGANIPLAYQYIYRYSTLIFSPLLSAFTSGKIAFYPYFLDGPSTKEMLLYHINTDSWPYLPVSSSNYGPDPRKIWFENVMRSMGYPQYCKKMALSYGSWQGEDQIRYWDYSRRVPNDKLLSMHMETYLRVLGIRILGTGLGFDFRTNPDGNGSVFKVGNTISRWKIKAFWFGVKLEYKTDDLIKIEKTALNVRPYCTKAASTTFDNIHLSGSSETKKFNVFSLFWLNYSTSTGHIAIDAELGIPWIIKVGTSFDMYTDGTSFGFIPPGSSFDDDSFYVKPLDDTLIWYPVTELLDRTPFDVVVTNPSYENRDHLGGLESINDNSISQCTTCPQFYSPYNVYSHILNREIGDDTLWLENTKGMIQFKIEAERGLYVNYHNPYYNYPSTTAAYNDYILDPHLSGNTMIISKENNYEILGTTPHEFRSNDDFAEQYLSPSDYIFVPGHMVLCCKNYDLGRRMSPQQTQVSDPILTVYPNPVSNGQILHVSYSFEKADHVQVDLYNTIGQHVATYGTSCSDNAVCDFSIPVSLTPGMYIVHIVSGKQQQVGRVVVAE